MVPRKQPVRRIPVKREQDVECMRRAGRVVAMALLKVGAAIAPGISTRELDAIAEQTIRTMDAKPAFLGYNNYPATACISINDEVVHGIPGLRTLKAGDVVGVDLGAIVEGWYSDAAFTYAVGEVPDPVQRLMAAGQGALEVGIDAARAGHRVRDIGAAIERFVLARGYSVVRDLCGHGIGRRLHEEPQVPNYPAKGGDLVLRPGMTLAIEPMVNAGGPDVVLEPDNWTFVTKDRSLSVHYEHTVLIRAEGGPEILTTWR